MRVMAHVWKKFEIIVKLTSVMLSMSPYPPTSLFTSASSLNCYVPQCLGLCLRSRTEVFQLFMLYKFE